MTERFSPSRTSVFGQKTGLSYYSAGKNARKYNNLTNSKRYIAYRWCSRLAASNLAGVDLAVEYLYGK